jgi:hypothetical protein
MATDVCQKYGGEVQRGSSQQGPGMLNASTSKWSVFISREGRNRLQQSICIIAKVHRTKNTTLGSSPKTREMALPLPAAERQRVEDRIEDANTNGHGRATKIFREACEREESKVLYQRIIWHAVWAFRQAVVGRAVSQLLNPYEAEVTRLMADPN